MKKLNSFFLTTLLLLITALIACKQNNDSKSYALGSNHTAYLIKGKITGANGKQVMLVTFDSTGRKIDTCTVANDSFSFKGKVMQPQIAIIGINQKEFYGDASRFILDNDTYTVAGSLDSTALKITVDGSLLQKDFAKLEDTSKAIRKKINDLFADMGNMPEALMQKKMTLLKPVADSMFKLELALKQKFIKENPNHFASLFLLQDVVNEHVSENFDSLKTVLNGFNQKIKQSPTAKSLSTYLDKLSIVQVGKTAPEIVGNTPDGKTVKLSDFKGKYVLVDFWASWCGPCRRENPNVVAAYNIFKNKNFTILGFSLDEETAAWKNAIVADKLTWTHISELKGWQSKAAADYGVDGIPANFLIDPTGKIVAKGLREQELHTKLAEVLK